LISSGNLEFLIASTEGVPTAFVFGIEDALGYEVCCDWSVVKELIVEP